MLLAEHSFKLQQKNDKKLFNIDSLMEIPKAHTRILQPFYCHKLFENQPFYALYNVRMLISVTFLIDSK